VIIPTRQERPDVLRATVEQAGAEADVCVIYDGERKQGLPCREIEMGTRNGPAQARHAGITTSSADVIVLTDSHMTFKKGWADAIAKAHKQEGNLLTCCRMEALRRSGRSYGEPIQGGAQLWLDITHNTMSLPVAAIWNDPPRLRGKISCVMGACYGLRREWYDAIGQPLADLWGWGMEEETLSIKTHLAGGMVNLLPQVVGHMFTDNPQPMNPEDKHLYCEQSRKLANLIHEDGIADRIARR